MNEVLWGNLSGWFESKILEVFVPVFSFVEEENTDVNQVFVAWQMNQVMPLYGYYQEEENAATQIEDRMTIEMILLAEANDDHNYIESGSEDSEADSQGLNEASDTMADQENIEELMQAENEAHLQQNAENTAPAEFTPHSQMAQVDFNVLSDYETLVKTFYTVDKNTMIGSDQLNVQTLSEKDMTISKENDGPQILIYHTHSQEAFADSVAGDKSTTIVGIGDYLTKILTERYGYQVLHHTGEYDVELRDDAYSKTLPAIEQLLADNPTIQVVIDLHRDAVPEHTRLVVDVDGRPTAQFMFFNGLSRTKKTGNISYLYNENLDYNLAFSFQMQVKAAEYYPGLPRNIYLKGYRYNMHLCPRTLLIELGAQNNTVEEARNACEPLAHILDMVLSGNE